MDNRTIYNYKTIKIKTGRCVIKNFILSVSIILSVLPGKAQMIIPVKEPRVNAKDPVRIEWNRPAEEQDSKWLPEFNTDQGNSAAYKEIPDSMYETNSDGYSVQAYRWYFYYNNAYRLDSSNRLYYTAYGQYENVVENRIYYPDGKIFKLINEEARYFHIGTTGSPDDSDLFPASTKEYIYDKNGNLVKQFNTDVSGYNRNSDPVIFYYDTSSYLYKYDSINRLISKTTSIQEEYFYDGNDLKYHVYLAGGIYLGVEKFDYLVTDSTRIVTAYYLQPPDFTRLIDLDTISYWDYIDNYTTTFDPEGKDILLIHRETFTRKGVPANPDYKAEYTYTRDSKLLHASYYTWGTPSDSTAWYESMRIDNTYDGNGYLTDYRMTYRDDRTGLWEIQAEKTYYYSTVPIVEAIQKTEKNVLDIYPNPANNSFTIKGLSGSSYHFVIYSLSGTAVQTGEFNNPEINISGLVKGIYILEISNGRSVFSGKFVKY